MGPSIFSRRELREMFLLLLYLLPSSQAWYGYSSTIAECQNFTDKRANVDKDVIGRIVLVVPKHLTSTGKGELKFQLASYAYERVTALTHGKSCKPDMINVPLSVNKAGERGASLNKYSFQDQWKFANDVYFTADGYFHYKSHFWNPNDYCVESISDRNLLIKLCKLNCTADLSRTNLYNTYLDEQESSSRICIPKCCGVDETLSLKDGTCRKLDDKEPTYFLPYLHLPKVIWYLKGSKNSYIDKHKILVSPVLDTRRTWNSTHGLVGGVKSIWGYLHFSRTTMNCSNYFSEEVRYDDVKDSGKYAKTRRNFRVEVRNGGVKVTFLTKSRKWKEYTKDFCVDGVDGWETGEGDGKAVNQVVLLCRDDEDEGTKDKEPKVLKLGDESSKVSSGVDYAYMVIAFILGILLLFGFTMYSLIRKTLNFNGNLILWHLALLTSWRLFTFLGLVVSLSDYAHVGSNAVMVVSSDYAEGKRLGWACVLIGIACHWAYLSSFLLMSAMNLNVWGYSFEMVGFMSTFIGLGAPLVMVIAFEIADAVNSDPWLDVIVPDYGVESCFIASWSAGYYLHLPILILVGLNLVFILVWTGRNFKGWFLKKGSSRKYDGKLTPGTPLFADVLLVLTFGWVLDATKWLRVYNNQKDNWFQTILLFVGLIAPSIDLFHAYCMNEVLLGLLTERFPSIQNMVKLLKNKRLIRKGRGLVGRICQDDADDEMIKEHMELRDQKQ